MTRRPWFALRLLTFLAVVALCLPLAGCSPPVAPPVATKSAEFRDSSDVWSLAFSPDGKTLAMSSPNSGEVHVWDWHGEPRLVHTLQQDDAGGQLNGLRFSPQGDFLASAHGATAKDQIVRIWHATTGAVAGDIIEPKSGAFPLTHAALEFTPDAASLIRVQAGGPDGDDPTKDTFIVYDTQTWARKWAISVNPTQARVLGLSLDGRYAAVAGWERLVRPGPPDPSQSSNISECNIVLVDLADQRVRFSSRILSYDCFLEFVVWNSDGKYIAVGGNYPTRNGPPALEIVDANTGKAVTSAPATSNMVALDYSPDGKYLLVGWGNVGVEIWDPTHTKLLQEISGHPSAARFSPDGRHLAIAVSREVTVWDVK